MSVTHGPPEFFAVGTIGDPFCPCGCGSWLGQCAREWNEQLRRQHEWRDGGCKGPLVTFPAVLPTFPSPFEYETPAPLPKLCSCGCGGVNVCVIRWILETPDLPVETIPTIVLTGFPEQRPKPCEIPDCRICGGPE